MLFCSQWRYKEFRHTIRRANHGRRWLVSTRNGRYTLAALRWWRYYCCCCCCCFVRTAQAHFRPAAVYLIEELPQFLADLRIIRARFDGFRLAGLSGRVHDARVVDWSGRVAGARAYERLPLAEPVHRQGIDCGGRVHALETRAGW